MPGKGKKKRPGLIDDFVIIDGLEPIGEADKRSVHSMPALRRSGGNEANQQLQQPGDAQSNEAMREEEHHKQEEQKKSGSVKDQNGPAPQDKEPEEQEVSLEEIGDVSLDSRLGDRTSIVSNEILQDIDSEKNQANQINNNLINDMGSQDEQQPAKQENQPNEGLNMANAFVPQQIGRSKWSTSAKMNNYFWRGVGSTIGKASVLPASLVGKIVTVPLKHFAQADAKRGQQNRSHRYIPGRDNMIFNDKETSGADILNDFRRVPTVWSYLTAARATENDGRDVDPKVTVYAEQPKPNSSRSMHYRNMGHTMLGIEYTRLSKITGKKERYNIKYGFYPASGLDASAAVMMLKGAVIPGRLMDNAKHNYDISKTYTVTRRQIENIAKASESYTEQGGYGYYTRNCTTFVRDMFRAGGLPEGAIDSIFTEENVRFNSLANGAFVFANAWNGFWDTDWQRQMGDLAGKDDRSYQGWGNKRVTKVDMDRYLATKNSAGLGIKSLAPASAGENMRRMTDAEGQVSSYRHASESLTKISSLTGKNLTKLANTIMAEGESLSVKIKTIMTKEQMDIAGKEFCAQVDALLQLRKPISILKDKIFRIGYTVKPEDVKEAYAQISDSMAKISRMYQTVLGSDSRLNKEVMNLLSTLQFTLEMLNEKYQKQAKASDTEEIGTRREEMLLNIRKIKVGDIEVKMTPSHYESYLYIYRTPLAAVNAYKRFQELTAERKGDDKNLKGIFSNKKLAEWKQLAQNEKLAEQLDQSHRTMLNKDSFSQQDIDYVFSLRKREMTGIPKRAARGNEMYTSHSTASETYMSLFFDMIFDGIQSTAQKSAEEGGCPTDAGTRGAALWMDKYLAEKTQRKMTGMAAIIRGIIRAYSDKPDQENIKNILHYFIQNAYLQKVFPSNAGKGPAVGFISTNLKDIYSKISTDHQMNFTKTIDSLVRIVMMENAQVTVLPADKKKQAPER